MMMKINYNLYKEFLDKLLSFLVGHFREDKIISCALFGSVARGEAKPYSDIDLLIVCQKRSPDSTEKFTKILFKLEKIEEYKKLLSMGLHPDPYPIFVTPEELSKNPLILLDILDEGIILYDKAGFLNQKLQKLKERLGQLGARKITFEDGSWVWDLKPDWKRGEVIEIEV
ncbi:MAG: nucleotidyltransferase domain-containing protein [Candidatus Aerophobetes bacterium]|nr:nucleotidyltransferase domain-containing protein [Candidatus Aerophobetes bacterium]